MANLEILKFPNDILTKRANPVKETELGATLDAFMSDMASAMYGAKGVGLAGPQVGDLRRILVADVGYHGDIPRIEDGVIWAGHKYGEKIIKMVNPILDTSSDETTSIKEGCLSFPDLEVRVERPRRIAV